MINYKNVERGIKMRLRNENFVELNIIVVFQIFETGYK